MPGADVCGAALVGRSTWTSMSTYLLVISVGVALRLMPLPDAGDVLGVMYGTFWVQD